jgi:hypothetical protein
MSYKFNNDSNMKVFFSVFVATQVVWGVVGYLLFPDTYKLLLRKFNDVTTLGHVYYSEPSVLKKENTSFSSNTLDHLINSSTNSNKTIGSSISFYKNLQDMTLEEYDL